MAGIAGAAKGAKKGFLAGPKGALAGAVVGLVVGVAGAVAKVAKTAEDNHAALREAADRLGGPHQSRRAPSSHGRVRRRTVRGRGLPPNALQLLQPQRQRQILHRLDRCAFKQIVQRRHDDAASPVL